jgi:hypothetical protein
MLPQGWGDIRYVSANTLKSPIKNPVKSLIQRLGFIIFFLSFLGQSHPSALLSTKNIIREEGDDGPFA